MPKIQTTCSKCGGSNFNYEHSYTYGANLAIYCAKCNVRVTLNSTIKKIVEEAKKSGVKSFRVRIVKMYHELTAMDGPW